MADALEELVGESLQVAPTVIELGNKLGSRGFDFAEMGLVVENPLRSGHETG